MSQSEKIRLEHQAARLFMRIYEREFGVNMRHIWHNEPRKPDVTCYFDHQKLDLEIAHLYGSAEEAKHYLGRELAEPTRQALEHIKQTPPDHRLLDALNALLASKGEKYYDSEQTWLVIRNVNPLWTREDFMDKCHLIQMPESHPFSQIWLLGDMEGRSGILQLYPGQ
jgi:hypothetical protein